MTASAQRICRLGEAARELADAEQHDDDAQQHGRAAAGEADVGHVALVAELRELERGVAVVRAEAPAEERDQPGDDEADAR